MNRFYKLQHKENWHAISSESIYDYMKIKYADVNEHYRSDHESSCDSESWAGIEGGVKAIDDAIAHGWPEGVKMAKEIMEELSKIDLPPAPCIRRRRKRGDVGDEVDLQKVYSGQLDTAWTYTQKADAYGNPIITIRSCNGANCSRSGKELFYQGVMAIILTDILEEAGYRVEIISYLNASGSFRDGSGMYAEFIAKPADAPLQMEKIIAVTALSGVFRYHGFKAMSSFDKPICSSLGSSEAGIPEEVINKGDIVLHNIFDKKSAIKKMNEVLKGLHEVAGGEE